MAGYQRVSESQVAASESPAHNPPVERTAEAAAQLNSRYATWLRNVTMKETLAPA